MKTLNDLQVAARQDPVIHSGMTAYELGQFTFEEALIEIVFALKEQKDAVTTNYIKHMQQCPGDYDPDQRIQRIKDIVKEACVKNDAGLRKLND